MTDLAGVRRTIQVEETQYRSSVSEALAQKIGNTTNFINFFQFDKHTWNLNESVTRNINRQLGDGAYICPENMEITGFSIYNGRTGVSGSTVVDILRVDSGGNVIGSIFSTKPEIDTSANDGSFQVSNLANGGSVSPTGHTLGIVTTLNLNKFDGLLLNLDSGMAGSKNLSVTIYLRPR